MCVFRLIPRFLAGGIFDNYIVIWARYCLLGFYCYYTVSAGMDHILARIKGAQMDEIKKVLKADAPDHAREGLQLRHLWRNIDDPEEIVFIFTAADLNRARKYIESMHEHVRAGNPNAILPQMLFLKGE